MFSHSTFQDVDTVIESVSHQTESLSISQRASKRREGKYDFGQKMLVEMKVR